MKGDLESVALGCEGLLGGEGFFFFFIGMLRVKDCCNKGRLADHGDGNGDIC